MSHDTAAANRKSSKYLAEFKFAAKSNFQLTGEVTEFVNFWVLNRLQKGNIDMSGPVDNAYNRSIKKTSIPMKLQLSHLYNYRFTKNGVFES